MLALGPALRICRHNKVRVIELSSCDDLQDDVEDPLSLLKVACDPSCSDFELLQQSLTFPSNKLKMLVGALRTRHKVYLQVPSDTIAKATRQSPKRRLSKACVPNVKQSNSCNNTILAYSLKTLR
jgi:hypothetical protein